MLINRRSVTAGLAAAVALAPARLAGADAPEAPRLAGPVYRQDGMLPRSIYRPLIFARWQVDEDGKGLLIRHCATGLTFRVVEPRYPVAVQELRPEGGRWRSADPLEVARIGHAARDVVSVNYWTKTYRRARHGGAVYYEIFPDCSRVMRDAPRIIAA